MKHILISRISSVILFFLFRGLHVLSRFDPRVKKEMERWPDGMTFKLLCGPKGPGLTMSWSGGGGLIRRKNTCPAQITMIFKSPERAISVLTGMAGISQAYAGHYFSLEGDIHSAMSFVRCVEITEAYLFPRIMTKRILREVPEKRMPALAVYGMILLGL